MVQTVGILARSADSAFFAMSAKAEREFKKRVEATFNAIDKNGTGHVSYITFLSWCKARLPLDRPLYSFCAVPATAVSPLC